MDLGLFLLLLFVLSTILFIIQRTEAKRRRVVIIVMGFFTLIVLWFVNLRQIWGEAILIFLLALFLNFLFWLLIGRYNPVGSSDSIRVLGMDD
ncbi:MAG: hypothetical protein JNJ78_13945 [Anaerolineae bacterium]|nr:hypothetical protein [Anaerolineae bacterium]